VKGSLRVRLVSDEETTTDVPNLEEDRFAPLLQILKDAEERGVHEPEFAYIGIQLRSLMNNPLEKLGVSQLKDYLEEAESAELIRIRRDGLQNYVSVAGTKLKGKMKGTKEEKEILNLLEKALMSLEKDELKPSEKALIGRMRELKPGWNLYTSCFESIPNLLSVAQKKLGVTVEADPPGFLIFPKKGKFPYIDSSDKTYNPFSDGQWEAFEYFLKAHPDIVAKGRYGLAQRLKKEEVPELSDMTLGLLSHLVQLAINKGWLDFQWNKISVSSSFLENT
jgi:hypothetical protein